MSVKCDVHCAVFSRTCIDTTIMQNNIDAVNSADDEVDQTADVKFCKNWYVHLEV